MRSRPHSIALLGLLLALAGASASWACQTTHSACVTPCPEANTSCCIASVDAGIAPPSLEPNLLQATSGTLLWPSANAECAPLTKEPASGLISFNGPARGAFGRAINLYLLDASFLI